MTDDPRLGPVPRLDAPAPRRRLVAVAVAGVVFGAWYFAWLLHPDRVGHPVLYGVLVVTELFNLFQIGMLVWTTTRVRAAPASRRGGPRDVDVFIPVYTEPVEVVEPTVRAAAALDGRTAVWLLDDGRRDELADLADRLGVGYLRRDDRRGAKAGNLNRALDVTDRPLVAVFDCDHVPRPDFLTKTLPAFGRPEVAFVQTPQYYANSGAGPVAAAAWAQQAFFFGPIAAAKDATGGMFCCGTNVVFRRDALADVGGFPEDSITEDYLLSVRLHERGWTGRYLPEVLAAGLAPTDYAAYASQQRRWARGCLEALADVARARLPLGLRLQYLWSSSFFLTGWTILVYLLLPLIRIATGAQPLAESSADQFLIHFAPYFGTALASVATIGRGTYTFAAYALLGASFPVHVAASVAAVLRRPGTFVVTPKGRTAEPAPLGPLRPTIAAVAALVAGAVAGLVESRSPSTLNNVAFLVLHATVLGTGLRAALARPAPLEPVAAPAGEPALEGS